MSQEQIASLSKFNQNPYTTIYGFFDEFRFLSNFHIVEIPYEGLTYWSTEAACMSAKTHDPEVKHALAATRMPSQAKKLGRQLTLRSDWEDVKLDVMEAVTRVKYITGPSEETTKIRQMLLLTEGFDLVEANWWGDRYWGVCYGQGENNLGKILMKIREELLGDKDNGVMSMIFHMEKFH